MESKNISNQSLKSIKKNVYQKKTDSKKYKYREFNVYREVKKYITFNYSIAIFTILLMTLVFNVLIFNSINSLKHNASIINVAGSQRMSVQRITALTAMIYFEDDEIRKNSLNILLKDSLKELESNLIILTTFVKKLENSTKYSEILESIYFDVPIKLQERLMKFNLLASKFSFTEGVDEKLMHQITNLASGDLLYDTDIAVSLFQKHSEKLLTLSKRLLLIDTIVNLIVILSQIVFVFRPLARKLAKKTSDLDKKSTHDSLTGLLNSDSFEPHFSKIIKNADSRGDTVSLFAIDIECFKSINDTEGYEAGDELLRVIGKRLRTIINPTSQVSRLSGDGFAIITAQNLSLDIPLIYAEELKRLIMAPIKYKDRLLRVTATFGISSYPNDAPNIKELLLAAYYSLSIAKKKGIGNIIAFLPEQLHAIERDKIIINSFERREHLDGLFIEFQPLIDLKSKLLTGCEALVRWHHPMLGRISPDQFLKLAVTHGHGAFIGNIIRRLAMEGFKMIRTAGLDIPSLSLNFMNVELNSLSGASELIDQLNVFGLSPKDIEIEVTEDVVLGHLGSKLESKLLELRTSGFRLALDDFGTGFAALEHLVRLEVDVIKLDRTFVAKITKDDRTIKIIKAIVQLAHGLSAKVVAEGIETQEQLEILNEISCDIGQGYFLARPMPVKELIAWHRNYTKCINCKT